MKISNSLTTTLTHISKAKWLFSLGLFLSFTLSAQEEPVSFLFVGDVMQHDGQIAAAKNTISGSYDYTDGWKFIRPIVNEYDIAVANLEVTLAGQPYKGYPQFSAPDALAETIVNSGFNVVLTANNHSCDRGAKGVIRTLDVLDKIGVKHTGTFRSQEERDKNYPLILHEKGLKIAMLNYTYGTNGLKVAPPLIINYIDSTVIKADVAKAKALGADYIVCNMHWGKEYTFLPNSYQKTYEALCYRIGVDMVIGGHPHTVQPIVKKSNGEKDQLTVWSLGNFVSNMQTRPTRGGLMVGASIAKTSNEITTEDVHYYLIYVMKKSEGAVTQYYILPDFDYNKFSPGFMDATNLNHAKNFFGDSRELFAKENEGATEKIVHETSQNGILYQQLLDSYYTVNIEQPDFDLAYNKDIGNLLQITVDESGKRYLMSGICASIHDAELVKNYIDFLDIGSTDIRKVTRTNNGLMVKEEN